MLMPRHKLTIVALLVLLVLALVLPAGVANATQLSTPDIDDVRALEDFFDGLAAAQRDAFPVAGMTISVVKDGELLFAKGYGYADVENQIPVEADETLFRPGSVSKLFVWTAMMQQVEAGTLELDTDVNEYLDFQIPNTFEQPITLRHLMTHTSGFEDQGLGLYVRSADEAAPLGDYLAQNMPERVFPPGEIIAYSNYGASLAAYIVQRVTGVPFYEYVEQNIFQPLGMEDSTFRQPVPPDLRNDLSHGYLYQQGR
ncbi:MAG: serine hydrolase domain-containing protein, partial [Chloroflexota bacterium]